jgi:AcrR family transcriptional regulator
MRVAVDHRESILLAAAKLFAKKPFHAVLMDEVAEKTGIAKGTIYRHFPTKDDLFVELSLRHLEMLGAAVGETAAGRGEPLQRLRLMLARLVEIIHAHSDFFRVMQRHECDFARKDSPFALRRRVIRDHFAKVIGEAQALGLLRAPFKPATAADLLLGMMRSVLRYSEPPPKPKKCAELVLNVFVNGLTAGNGRGGGL